MSRVVLLIAVAAALSSCAAPSAAGATPIPASRTPEAALPPATPTAITLRPPWGSRVVIRSSSLSLAVEDPTAAAAELEDAVIEAGGFVASGSSWPSAEGQGYASLSARVPPEALADVRRAALALADQVQSESTYSQDVTADYGILMERLEDIGAAESRLLRLAPDPEDPAAFRVVILLSELLRQERRNVEMQLQSYEDRANLASLDVTFTQAGPPMYLFYEGTPTPIR